MDSKPCANFFAVNSLDLALENIAHQSDWQFPYIPPPLSAGIWPAFLSPALVFCQVGSIQYKVTAFFNILSLVNFN